MYGRDKLINVLHHLHGIYGYTITRTCNLERYGRLFFNSGTNDRSMNYALQNLRDMGYMTNVERGWWRIDRLP